MRGRLWLGGGKLVLAVASGTQIRAAWSNWWKTAFCGRGPEARSGSTSLGAMTNMTRGPDNARSER